MASIELTEGKFQQTIDENGIVIIDFWAEWCAPCKAFAPVFEKISDEFPDVVFAKVNTEEEQNFSAAFGIRSIPTTVVFKEGIGVFMNPGAIPEAALRDLVTKIIDLDMEEVKKEIEEQERLAQEMANESKEE